jgi:Glycosyl-4,4'-diaponeurosporenoate acyltransferase
MRPQKASGLSPRILSSLYNGAVNLFWSLLAFVPVSVFCYRFMERGWLWGFVAISFVACVAPASILRRLSLGSTVKVYRRLGVHWANHAVQNGALINRLIRRWYPDYQPMRSRTSLACLAQTTYMQERFHWMVLVFFLLCNFYAGIRGHPGWALLITLLNLVYNLYPIWLQQYIRVRMNRSGSKRQNRRAAHL